MPKDLNHFTFTGRLTKDPELQTTRTGRELLRFTIAVNDVYKQDGLYKETTSFFPITAWGNQASALSRMLYKGQFVVIAGSIKQSKYQDKNGNGRTAINFIVSQVIPINPRRKEQEEDTEEELM